MLRHKVVSGAEFEWTLVSAKRPCTVCGAPRDCRRGFEDEFGCCTRVLSEWPLNAGGWVHRLAHQIVAEVGVDSPAVRGWASSLAMQRTGSSR